MASHILNCFRFLGDKLFAASMGPFSGNTCPHLSVKLSCCMGGAQYHNYYQQQQQRQQNDIIRRRKAASAGQLGS